METLRGILGTDNIIICIRIGSNSSIPVENYSIFSVAVYGQEIGLKYFPENDTPSSEIIEDPAASPYCDHQLWHDQCFLQVFLDVLIVWSHAGM